MSVDGRFIEHLAKELDSKVRNSRINKISQLAKADFLFSLNNGNLYISLSTALARVHLVKDKYSNFITPGGFCMFLRKYIEKGIITKIESLEADRIIQIKVNNRNDIGDLTDYYVIIEMFGRYANLIVLDENRVIINAYKHIHPFENIDRIIVNGVKYETPKDERINPNNLDEVEVFFNKGNINYKTIIENIKGMSPLIARHIIEKANYSDSKLFQAYLDIYNDKVLPTKAGKYFYYLDIFNEDKEHFNTLSELLENQYDEASSLDRVKQIHKYLHTFVKNNLEKDVHKLEKLSKDLHDAENNQINRIKGDLLLQNNNLIDKTKTEVKLYSYELDKEVEIEIDRMACPIDNANKYYAKYKKQKTAITHINNQISLTKKEISYFEDLLNQINENYNIKDLEEIQEELITNKYLPKKKSKNKIKSPNYDVYIDELNIQIVVGKNNIQNNFITHKLAKKDFLWFHVQKQSGSHVVVMTNEELKEPTIRAAANLAAYYSKSKDSSSVPVDYTKIKYVKKIPGEVGSYVSYTNQKTIYIDPDYELIKKLRKG